MWFASLPVPSDVETWGMKVTTPEIQKIVLHKHFTRHTSLPHIFTFFFIVYMKFIFHSFNFGCSVFSVESAMSIKSNIY